VGVFGHAKRPTAEFQIITQVADPSNLEEKFTLFSTL